MTDRKYRIIEEVDANGKSIFIPQHWRRRWRVYRKQNNNVDIGNAYAWDDLFPGGRPFDSFEKAEHAIKETILVKTNVHEFNVGGGK